MKYILRFDAENTKLGIFFNETAALKSKYSLKKSKVKGINLAMYKSKVVGMQFDARKVVEYDTIYNFLLDQMDIEEEETIAILSQMIGLSLSYEEISDTLH